MRYAAPTDVTSPLQVFKPISKQRKAYKEDGFVPSAGALSLHIADRMSLHIRSCIAHGLGHKRDLVLGGAGSAFTFSERRYRDTVIGGESLAPNPDFMQVYLALRAHLQSVSRRAVVTSPFKQSSITCKVYAEAGAEHGWHTETNSLTALLYLTPCDYATRLEYCPPNARAPVLHYIPKLVGEIAIIRGHNVWHRVPPMVHGGGNRLAVVFNYYHPTDITRPPNFDKALYT